MFKKMISVLLSVLLIVNGFSIFAYGEGNVDFVADDLTIQIVKEVLLANGITDSEENLEIKEMLINEISKYTAEEKKVILRKINSQEFMAIKNTNTRSYSLSSPIPIPDDQSEKTVIIMPAAAPCHYTIMMKKSAFEKMYALIGVGTGVSSVGAGAIALSGLKATPIGASIVCLIGGAITINIGLLQYQFACGQEWGVITV